MVDRTFRRVGRIKKVTGALTKKEAEGYEGMLRALYPRRIDVLKAIKPGVVSIPEVYTAWQTGDGDALPTVESFKRLTGKDEAEGVYGWAKSADVSEAQRRNHRQAFKGLLAGEPEGATVADLPALLRRYKGRAGGHVMFNRVKASVLAYLRDTLGRRHDLYEKVADIAGFKEAPAAGIKLTADQVRKLATDLGNLGPMVWALALSGMRRGEYWGTWEELADRYHIHGTKTDGSDRDIPYLGKISRPLVGYQAFRRHLQKAHPGLTPHDFRHTYMHWMEEAGISRIRRKLYLGHRTSDVTEIYERHELTGFLQGDAARLLEYIGDVPALLRMVG